MGGHDLQVLVSTFFSQFFSPWRSCTSGAAACEQLQEFSLGASYTRSPAFVVMVMMIVVVVVVVVGASSSKGSLMVMVMIMIMVFFKL